MENTMEDSKEDTEVDIKEVHNAAAVVKALAYTFSLRKKLGAQRR